MFAIRNSATRFGVEASDDIPFPLRITNAGGDGSAQASCQPSALISLRSGREAELINRADAETWLIGRLGNDADAALRISCR